MSYNKKMSDVITRLVRLTHENKITWILSNPPPSIAKGTDNIITLYFHTKFSDSSFAIYREKYHGYNYEMEGYSWQERTIFAIFEDGKVIWEETDDFAAVGNLMEAVRIKIVNLDGILQELSSDVND